MYKIKSFTCKLTVTLTVALVLCFTPILMWGSTTRDVVALAAGPDWELWPLDGEVFRPTVVGQAPPGDSEFYISNDGPGSLTSVSASITTGSNAFAVTKQPPSTVPANGNNSAKLDVGPKAGLAAGTYYATLTVTTGNAGSSSVQLSIKVFATNTYTMSASPTEPDFGSQQVGYAQRPTQTITITNTGSENISMNDLPFVENWTLAAVSTTWSTSAMHPDGRKQFTIRPNDNLPAGTYNPTITISGSGGTSVQIRPTFTVIGPSIAVTTTGLSNLKVGQAVNGASVLYSLTDGIYTSSINSSHFTLAGLPPGLTVGSAQRTSNTVVTIPITGAPTTYNANTTILTSASSIPADNITDVTIAIVPTGTITASAVARGDGAAVSGSPTVQNKTVNSVTVNAVTNSGTTGQSVEYAISTSDVAIPLSGWQSGTVFSELNSEKYYVFARTAANTDYNSGAACVSEVIAIGPEPAIVVTATGLSNLKVGQAVSGASVLYTLTNGAYALPINTSYFTVTELPPGLTMGAVQQISDMVVNIPITGTPTTYNVNTTTLAFDASGILTINIFGETIPAEPTGEISVGPVARGDGAAVSGVPTEQNKTSNSITVNIVTNTGTTGQSVEYAISTSGVATPLSEWQSGTTFNDLDTGNTYYVYARTQENTNYSAGAARVSVGITLYSPPSDSDLTFSVGNTQASPGREILVPISIINNNNALDVVAVTVTFDSTRLEWQSLGTYTPGNTATHPWTHGGFMPFLSTPGSIGVNSVTFYFMDQNGIYMESGALVTLKLCVRDDAPAGDAVITLSFSSVGDSRGALNSSQYNNEPGKVVVSDIIYGDVNGDGVVDAFDALYLARHLAQWLGYETISLTADVNSDGVVDAFDALYLARYLAGWPGYEILGSQ
ncbi:MAG: dockerin type I domain-containing protein [Oscillospiraceae bacterium]|nr:dockerin type I domain-containing protein [Oscillospiraceae bacterium]